MLKEPTMVDLTENCLNGIPLELLDKPALIAYSKMLESLVYRLQKSKSLTECMQWSTNDGDSIQENCYQRSEKSRISVKRYAPKPYKGNLRVCKYCSEAHKFGTRYCRAFNKRCQFCGRLNHVIEACWIKRRELYRPELSSFRELNEMKNHKVVITSSSHEHEKRIHQDKVNDTDVFRNVDSMNTEENACSEVSGKEFDGSEAEYAARTPVENTVRKKKRKSSKSRGKNKLDKSFSNKGAQQENGGIKPPEESGISSFAQHSLFTNGGVGEEKGSSKEAETSSKKVNKADVSNGMNETNRDGEKKTAEIKDKENFSAADPALPKTNKDTESGVKYDDHTKYILNEISEAVANNDIAFWKSDYIREDIYRKGGIAQKQYDEMRRAHYPV